MENNRSKQVNGLVKGLASSEVLLKSVTSTSHSQTMRVFNVGQDTRSHELQASPTVEEEKCSTTTSP
jgi:hypothetical protein